IRSERIACIIGTSKGGLTSFARACATGPLREQGGPTDSSTDPAAAAWWSFLPNAAAATVATRFGLEGPSLCPVAACATGLVSLIRGFSLIQSGEADVAVCGSADASVQLPVLASFRRLGVLARGFEDPATACRPFDESRNGFAVGEGAGILVLESESHARARGAAISGRMLAGLGGADLSGITSVETEPAGLIHLLNAVCHAGGIAPARLGTISLHGTATLANDLAESRAVQEVCGPATAGIPCTSLKGGLGHLLGAAGSVETAALLLGMRDGLVPPTVNLQRPGAGCCLSMATGQAVRKNLPFGLKLSLGFGGQLAAALFARD
ncbi:MAG: hypothetical protein KDA79_24615, partial [Planctomycetaceae bacterium]|nr:hypothetical protein [Planctomycetaceae bacterium]